MLSIFKNASNKDSKESVINRGYYTSDVYLKAMSREGGGEIFAFLWQLLVKTEGQCLSSYYENLEIPLVKTSLGIFWGGIVLLLCT